MARRVLITGSRVFDDRTIVSRALKAQWDIDRDLIVVHGAATGADSLAHDIAAENAHLGIKVEPHPAKWRVYGRSAGIVRNAEMVGAGADVCLAFFKVGVANRGTQDCVSRAATVGIPVIKHWA